MRKLSILAIPAILVNLSFATIFATSAYADSTVISQASVDAAKASPGTNVDGLSCSAKKCQLDAGNYLVSGDIGFGNASLFIAQNGATILDLGGYEISGSNAARGVIYIQNPTASIDIKNGKVANTNPNMPIAIMDRSDASSGEVAISNIIASDNNILSLVGSTATLNNVSAASVKAEDTQLTIDGGTYGSDTASESALLLNDTVVTINGGTFKSGQASAVSVDSAVDRNTTGTALVINGGTFSSTSGSGIDFTGYKSAKINGGVFSGADAGVSVGGYHGDFSIFDGTFRSAEGNAIHVLGASDPAVFNDILVNNSNLSDTITLLSDGSISIGGTETRITRNNTEPDTRGSGSHTDESLPDVPATDSSIGKAPSTGVMTAEGASALEETVISAAIAAIIGTTIYTGKRRTREDDQVYSSVEL